MHSGYFGIKTTRELVAHVFPLLVQFGRCALEEDVQAQDQGEEEARCQEILAVAATNTYPLLKRLGRDCLRLPIEKT